MVVEMNGKSVIISNNSFEEAYIQAKLQGVVVVGQGRNKKGQYVIFVRKPGFY